MWRYLLISGKTYFKTPLNKINLHIFYFINEIKYYSIIIIFLIKIKV